MSQELQDFACPIDEKCGTDKSLTARTQAQNMQISTAMSIGETTDSCTYMITAGDSSGGELIQISEVLLRNVELTIYYGARTF